MIRPVASGPDHFRVIRYCLLLTRAWVIPFPLGSVSWIRSSGCTGIPDTSRFIPSSVSLLQEEYSLYKIPKMVRNIVLKKTATSFPLAVSSNPGS